MTDEQLTVYYRAAYGLEDGETYDPDVHENVPALAFGSSPVYVDLVGPGEPMDLENDLMDALWAQSGSGAQ